MTVPEGGSFDEVARKALKAAEEIFREECSSVMPNPLTALAEDPPLNVEDFLVEKQGDLTHSESDAPLKLTLPAPAQTQTTPWSDRSRPIILDEDK